MVKRGRDISHKGLIYKSPKYGVKKYDWICEKCGAVYISRENAELCEALHESLKLTPKNHPVYKDLLSLKEWLELRQIKWRTEEERLNLKR